jgi:Domain of unknown function (DUF4465)/PEP-CTERM motif
MPIARRPSARETRGLSTLVFKFFPTTLALFCLDTSFALAGPFLDSGHTAGAMSAWATAVEAIVRGPLDIADPNLGQASHGVAENALGVATGDSADVVSLGDGGSAVLYFESGIGNGPEDDFAIFENSFADLNGLFAELAYVEVSSDGISFARFDSDALNIFPVPSFDTLDPTEYHGLAGRHAAGIGTGFDLDELATDPLILAGSINLYDVRYVRVVDVIGDGSTVDSAGNPIYDPYSTPFTVGGFDLEAVGVIHVPEAETASGLLLGLLGLTFVARRCRGQRDSGSSLAGLVMVLPLAVLSTPAAALTSDFEDLGLGLESVYDGSDLSGGYSSGGIFFENSYSTDFGGFFSNGFAASTTTDATTPGPGNAFSNITGSGAGGSATYGVFFDFGSIVLPTATLVAGAEFTNTTYAALSMRFGDAFARQFGGQTGTDEDFFRLLVEGIDDLGQSTGFVELMLADYRSAEPSEDFILKDWVFLDLVGLGVIRELRFSFESSDVGSFGINTPKYFAIDNLVTIPEPGTGLLLGLGLGVLGRWRRSAKGSQR